MAVKRLSCALLSQSTRADGSGIDTKVKTDFVYLHRGQWIASWRISDIVLDLPPDATRREIRKQAYGAAWSEVEGFMEGAPVPGDGEAENFWVLEDGPGEGAGEGALTPG
jgi:hypothetical protein